LDKKIESVEQSAVTQYPIVTLYDISGSAHFFNKCDNGLSLWRDKYAGDNLAQIHVQKIRFRECGKLGMADLRFDWQSGRYENL
jgi:twinkle protein